MGKSTKTQCDSNAFAHTGRLYCLNVNLGRCPRLYADCPLPFRFALLLAGDHWFWAHRHDLHFLRGSKKCQHLVFLAVAGSPWLELLEEVVALIVNKDECGEVFYCDFPDGFHA